MTTTPHISITPRMLRRAAAAAYYGVSGGTFDKLVQEGIAPAPSLKYGTRVVLWDRAEIDKFIDKLQTTAATCEGWEDIG